MSHTRLACKPHSVREDSRPIWAIIYLGHASPHTSCSLPEAPGTSVPGRRVTSRPRVAAFASAWLCSGRGLPGRPYCYGRRWSLTPPFHPYLNCLQPGRYVSVALPVDCSTPGVTRRHTLGSADFPRKGNPLRNRPANLILFLLRIARLHDTIPETPSQYIYLEHRGDFQHLLLKFIPTR